MKPENLIKNLELTARLLSGGDDKNCRSAEFYSWEEFFPVLKKTVPFGKVAVLYLKSSFEKFGKENTENIRRLGIKPYNYVMPQGVTLSFENIFDVITLPEDVRAIIYFDGELGALVNYVATVLNVLCMRVVKDPFVKGVLAPFVCFDSGVSSDIFPIACDRYVFVDFAAVKDAKDNKEKAIAYILSRYLSVIDGKILAAAYGETWEDALQLILSAVNYCRNNADNMDLGGLTYWTLATEIADAFSFGALLKNSSAFSLSYILKRTEDLDFYLSSCRKLFGVYLLYLKEESENLLSVPDYNARAKTLSEKTGKDFISVAEGIIKQRKALKENAEKINAAVSRIKVNLADIESVFAAFSAATEKLSVKETSLTGDTAFALKSCGDIRDTFNLMTVIRESGLTELI